MKRVVVTGLGALTPIGNNIEEYTAALMNGVSGANAITHFDASKFKTQFACEIKNLDTADVLDRRDLRRMDKFSQYAMMTAHEAIKQSGIDSEDLNKDRIGVIWASGIGGLRSLEKEIEDFEGGDGTPRYNPFMIPKMIADIASGLISMRFGFRGINYATVSACLLHRMP